METLTTYTTDGNLMVAFDGTTYFVKFVNAYRAKWLPVKSVMVDRLNNKLILKGIYGVNTGNRQTIVNRKGQDLTSLFSVVVKLDSFQKNNLVKLYESSVKTSVTLPKVKRAKVNKPTIKPPYFFLETLKILPEEAQKGLPENIRKYL